jgi:hypothetical protein
LTLQFFKLLESRKLRNPVVVVTKKLIPDHFIDNILSLEHVRPIFFLSYSALPGSVEKGVNPEENRINFQKLSDHGLPVIHYWRPLLEVNGTIKVLQEVLDYVVQYAIASVYVGIKLNPHLIPIYNENPYLKVPEDLSEYYGDYIPPGVEGRLRALARERYPNYPLYMHTSCAVSLALSIPDYNATVYRDRICKGSECPPWKRKICDNARSIPSREQIKALLDRVDIHYDYQVNGDAVYLSGDLDQEQFAFLLHQLNYPLIATDIRYNRVLRGSIFKRDERNTLTGGIPGNE